MKLETLTPDWKPLFGVKHLEFPPMTLDHLGKGIEKIGTSYLWSVPPYAGLAGLVSYASMGCVALVFSLWHIRGPHTHIQAITKKHRSPINTVCIDIKDTSFPAQFRYTELMPPWKCPLSCSITNLPSLPNQLALQGP